MKKQYLFLLALFSLSFQAVSVENSDPADFMKQTPYRQLVKDMALARCLAQLSQEPGFSNDIASSANAMREWMPFDIASGDEKINALIKKYKDVPNSLHSEVQPGAKNYTLSCFRLYHSKELDSLTKEVISGDPQRHYSQDNKS